MYFTPLGRKKGMMYWSCYSMDDPWKSYTKWKKPVTKTTYCMIQLIQKVQTRQSDRTTGGSLRLEVRQVLGEMGGNGFTGWWKCSQMFSGYGCTALWIYKNHGIIYVQLVNHLVCELYLKKAFFKKKKKEHGMKCSWAKWMGTVSVSHSNPWIK